MKLYSWELEPTKKHIDKCCFSSNQTGIPVDVRLFFGVENLGYRESVSVVLEHAGQSYTAKIESPKNEAQYVKTRLVWEHGFTDLLRAKFPCWEENFMQDINYARNNRPQIVFERTDESVFKVFFTQT